MPLTTVDVPQEFEPLFAEAEKLVAGYFASYSHDPHRAAIEIGGERYILLRAASLSTEFFAMTRHLYEPDRAMDADEFSRNILFDLAHAIGKADAQSFHEKMNLSDPIQRLSAGPVHFAYTGWASVKLSPESHPSPDKHFYLVYDHPHAFEADAWLRGGQKPDAPVCVMNAGYSSGWCEASFGIPLVSAEVACRAMGDPCCRFVMAPPDAIADRIKQYRNDKEDAAARPTSVLIPELFVRKRLEDELRTREQSLNQHNALLSAINQIYAEALVCDNDADLATAYLRLATQLTESDIGFVAEVDRTGELAILARQQFAALDVNTLLDWKHASMAGAPSGTTVRAAVLQEGQPLIVNSTNANDTSLAADDTSTVIHSLMSFPLMQGDATLGLLLLANKTSSYTLADQGIVEGLGAAFIQALMRKRAEISLSEKEDDLRHAQKMQAVGQLGGGIAHEFNNLLQVISGYTKFALKAFPDDDPGRADLEQVLKAADRAAVLTRQLLAFSHRSPLQLDDFSAVDTIQDLVKLVRPVIGAHVQIDTSMAQDTGMIHADPAQMQQVLMNLCINARDAMPSGGRITIHAQQVTLEDPSWEFDFHTTPGRYVVLSVADTGCGMSREQHKRIFEPFYTTKEVGRGTGLGLAVVYGIMQQHKGAIEVRSEPGKGTEFRLYLPSGKRKQTHERMPSESRLPRGNETVLLVEDELLVARSSSRGATADRA